MVTKDSGRWVFQLVGVGAKQVFLAGEFNGWSTTSTPMQRSASENWEVGLELEPGDYRFRYVTDDGRWFTDYAAFSVVPNRYGSWDSVVHVPGPDEPQAAVPEDETALKAEEVHNLNEFMALVWCLTRTGARKGAFVCDTEDVLRPESARSPQNKNFLAAAGPATAAPGAIRPAATTTPARHEPPERRSLTKSRKVRRPRGLTSDSTLRNFQVGRV